MAEIYRALSDEDWARAADLVETEWGMLSAFRVEVIRAVADALPEEFLDARPRWATVRRFAAHVLTPRRLRPLTYARSQPRASTGSLIDELTALVENGMATRSRGDFASTARFAEQAMRIGRDPALMHMPGYAFLPPLFFQIGMSAELSGREELALEAFQRAFGGSAATGDLRTAANSSAELALIHTFAGRMRLAQTWAERHFAVTSTAQDIHRLRNTIHLALASRLHDELRFDEARAELDKADTEGVPEHAPEIISHRFIFDAFAGERSLWELLSAIDSEAIEFASQAPGVGLGEVSFDYARALALSFGGQPERALPILTHAAEDEGDRLVLSRRASTEYLLGDFDAASRDADFVLATLRSRPRPVIEALVVKAAVAWRHAEPEAVAEHYRQAVRMSGDNKLYVSLAVIPLEDTLGIAQVAFGDDLPDTLRRVLEFPHIFLPPVEVVEKLTAQEQRVVAALAQGATLVQAATRLHISENTVKVHTRAIYRKLNVGSRAEMIAEAMRRGLI